MIRSMTGFGSASHSSPLGEIGVDVKSLNNRFLDISLKVPREFNAAEARLREEVKRHVRRGKVDIFMRWTPIAGAQPLYAVNQALLRHYAEQVAGAFGGVPDLPEGARPTLDVAALLSLPGVVVPTGAAADDGSLADTAVEALRLALISLDAARSVEGAALASAVVNHLNLLDEHRTSIECLKDQLLDETKARLRDRVATLEKSISAAVDPVRIETELMLYADKSDITEELVRLDSHLKTFRGLAEGNKASEPVGKPMDFLVQELLREANTVGNKARGVAVASRIVQMKTEIEKLREQVQNLE